MAIELILICPICYSKEKDCKAHSNMLERWKCSCGRVYVDRTNARNCECKQTSKEVNLDAHINTKTT